MSGWSPAALGKGEMTPAASLPCWQLCWCVGESQSRLVHHWYVLLVQSLRQERVQSHYTYALGEWSWLVDAYASAYPLFFKSTLEKKRSSAQVGDFITHISGTSGGTQLLIWCCAFLTSGLLTQGRPFLSLCGSVVSFHPVCSLVLWKGAEAAGGE